MSPNEIGFFQFDNLVKNRVPFALLSFELNWDGFYVESIYQNHLMSLVLDVSHKEFLGSLKSKSLPKDFAIVAICKKGKDSARAIKVLEKEGYSNVYSIVGGFESLVKDRS